MENVFVTIRLTQINQILGLKENQKLTVEEQSEKIKTVLLDLYQEGHVSGYARARRNVKRFLTGMEENLKEMRSS